MLIAHVSDFHVFSSEKETPLVRDDAAEAARKVVADLAAFRPKLDAVMLTGDLTDRGSDADYALLKEILSPLEMPVFIVPGNHDKRQALMTAFPNLPFAQGGFANFEETLGNTRVLGLDTLQEGRPEGHLCEQRLAWLEDRLSRPFDGITFLLMHHAPFPSGMAPLDRMSLVGGRKKFAQLISCFRKPLRILSGHIHRPYQGWWNGVFCAVAGSPAFQVALDFSDDHEPPLGAMPYAWFLHVTDGEDLAVHARHVTI